MPWKKLGLPVSLAVLTMATFVVAASAVQDLRTRATSPEQVVQRYFAALEASDAEAALAQIAPAARDADAAFVRNGLGNAYEVDGVAVRTPSVLDRLRGASADPQEVTVFLTITEAVSGVTWQATPRVTLVHQNGRWYLGRAPLSPVATAPTGPAPRS